MKLSFLVMVALLQSPLAGASAEMDRQYAMETVGVLRPWDNVDGLFAEYLRDSYKEYFASQSRFKYQDISQADPVLLKSKLSYSKLIEDPEVLQQLARSMRSESLIRTKVFKEGRKYRFNLDWIHSGRLDVLSSENFIVNDPEPGQAMEPEALSVPLFKAVDSLLAALPFGGQVTGRDKDWITLSLNRTVKAKKGDQLVLATIDEVKRHPLLKSIAEWKLSEVGRVEVDEVDGNTVFAKIISEEAGKQIARYQKVTKVIVAAAPAVENKGGEVLQEEVERKRYEPPKMGFIQGGLWLGSYGRENSSLNASTGKTGGGFLYGADALAQLWLNRNIFADLGLRKGFFSFSQQDIQTGNESLTGKFGSASRFQLDLGYSYLVTGQFWGPKFFGKLGYHSLSYNTLPNSTEQTGETSYGALFLGIGGELPLRDLYGAFFSLDLGLFKSTTDTGFSVGSNAGTSDVCFQVGGYYRMAPRINLRLAIDIQGQGTDYDTGASLSHRVISFMPSVQYYF